MQTVARMERSEIRELNAGRTPDFAALHPGYSASRWLERATRQDVDRNGPSPAPSESLVPAAHVLAETTGSRQRAGSATARAVPRGAAGAPQIPAGVSRRVSR